MAGIANVLLDVQNLLLTAHPTLLFSINVGSGEIVWGEAPPGIVWVILGASHNPAEKVAGRNRSVLTRNVNVVGHVWGADLDHLELLVDDTIASLHRVAHANLAFGGEEWPEMGEADGHRALVKFSIAMPVIERKFVHSVRADDDLSVMATPTKVVVTYDETTFPQTLGLTGFWRDFAGGVWSGTPAAGSSGTKSIAPAQGGALVGDLNGRGIASFSATDDGTDPIATSGYFESSFGIGDVIGTSSFSMWCLAKMDSLGDMYAAFIRDNGDNIQLSTGVSIGGMNTHALIWSTPQDEYTAASGNVNAGEWFMVQCRHDGTLLSVRINGGSWDSVPSPPVEDLSSPFKVGFGLTNQGEPLSFSIAEFGVTDQKFDDATFDSIREYARCRYDLDV